MSEHRRAPADTAALVRAAELMLHSPAIRAEPDALESLLAPEFAMHGTSGLLWSRREFLQSVSGFPSSTVPFEIAEVGTQLVAEDVVLIRYVSTLGEKRARRASLWRLGDDGPQIVFHQGTPIS